LTQKGFAYKNQPSAMSCEFVPIEKVAQQSSGKGNSVGQAKQKIEMEFLNDGPYA
jgi:hypothetical protein